MVKIVHNKIIILASSVLDKWKITRKVNLDMWLGQEIWTYDHKYGWMHQLCFEGCTIAQKLVKTFIGKCTESQVI